MKIIPAELPDVCILSPDAHRDDRGFFLESWRDEWSDALKLDAPFVQDNHALSVERGVLRGLHYQAPPHAQAKLVWAIKGAVYDVAVDLRTGSPSFGRCYGAVLSAENMLRLFVPKGFAHGYLTLEQNTEILYKVNAYYAPNSEGGVRWNDPSLAIPWPDISPALSEKDTDLPLMETFISPFIYQNK